MTPRSKARESTPTRRTVLRTGAALTTVGALGSLSSLTRGEEAGQTPSRGNLHQSVCRWCYSKISLDDLCASGKRLGLVGIDLLTPNDFPTIKKHGLVCTMTSSHPLSDGLCDPKFHEASLKAIHTAIEATAKEGWKNVICFSGNSRGIDRRTGMKNCVKALAEIVPVAEKAGVILQMELLNSKVDHADYMCDNSTWGVELVKRVGSDHFKLLYDIYHMQIMEGDVIRTIETNRKYYGHFHTGGNPGRHELDANQELNYAAIARALVGLNFQGYMAHEFIPVRDPLTSLAEAVELCSV
ncbi:MAG: TIM barrel protein [Isosphaeraceae bacterium]